MTGKVILQKRIMVEDLQNNRDVTYVFGDNMQEHGRKGQSVYGRDQPNAVGIPTKWFPSMTPDSFFSDNDFREVVPTIDKAFNRLIVVVQTDGIVVWPADGVGTGLAQLRTRAPMIYRRLAEHQVKLFDLGGVTK